MVTVENLTKTYGTKLAVDNISFTVNDGEILGFLGPNGAGKSTAMNIIAGYTSSTTGTVTVNGAEILENPLGVKRQIGYLPEHPPLYLDMTVKEYLSFMYDLKKVKGYKEEKARHIAEVCELVKISDVFERIIKNLSKGYQQRVGIAQALLGKPSVLILDEPTVGLDPNQIIEIRNLIKNLGKQYTVILSSHILSEVQATCERILVINKGRIVADGTADEISADINKDALLVARVEGPERKARQVLDALPYLTRIENAGSFEAGTTDFILHVEEGKDVRRALFQALAKNSLPLLGLKTSALTLEEIFLLLTTRDDAEQTTTKKGKRKKAPKPEAKADTPSAEQPEMTAEPDTAPEAPAETGPEPGPDSANDDTQKEGGEEA